MEITTIVFIVISFVVGIIIASLFRIKTSKDKSVSQKDDEITQKYEALLAEAKEKVESQSKKEEELRQKYENLLAEAKEQCSVLDSRLKDALDGKIDDSIKAQLAEADKLKKKIKDLEDELEENEDDIAKLKKTIKTKDSDLSELQDTLTKSHKELKHLQDNLSDVQRELDEKLEELQLKINTLDFIQEILSAPEVTTADTTKLKRNIDDFESFVKNQYFDIMSYLFQQWKWFDDKKSFENYKNNISDGFARWATSKRKSWLDGKTTIAFVGEFSAGKTSIVNRLLSQDDPNVPRLPVSTKATTAIPTYIAGGPTVNYSFIAGDDKQKMINENTFKSVSKDILDQVKGVSSLIKYFVMTYKNPHLEGLSILDTPGFNSNDSEDRDRTIDVINECDALFWVFDVNAGTVNRSSISIIKEKLNKPLYVVINKVDTKSDSEVQKVETLIKQTLSDEGLDVKQFIRFSSKSPLDDMMNPIKEVGRTAVRDTFVENLGDELEACLSAFDDAIQSANQEYIQAEEEGDSIQDRIDSCLEDIKNDCNKACEMPQFKEGFMFFTDDRYVMPKNEGDKMLSLLKQIATTRVQTLFDVIEANRENAQDIQAKYMKLIESKTGWQKVNDCNEQYKKVIVKINKS